jgi:quercetin dioxygenase-like cupin family protein
VTDWIGDPVLKLRMRLQADGDMLTGDVELQPGGGIGKHLHPKQEERWTVFEGKVRFHLGRRRQIAPIGAELIVAAGVKHSLKNVGDSTARLRFTADPALDLEPFLTEAVAMSRAGKVTSFGIPTSFGALLDGAMLIDRYKDTCVLMSPPPVLQSILLAPLARVGRRRRLRS